MKLQGSCHCRAVTFEVESYTPYPFMRCYCSICRKTAGGGGYAINIMGQADTLKIRGKKAISIYHAKMYNKRSKRTPRSSGSRHFCKYCASCLWISDPQWPQWIYPFASCIDTPLPKPPEQYCILLNSKANWCEPPPKGKKNKHFEKYPDISIEDWHKQHGIFLHTKKSKTV